MFFFQSLFRLYFCFIIISYFQLYIFSASFYCIFLFSLTFWFNIYSLFYFISALFIITKNKWTKKNMNLTCEKQDLNIWNIGIY